MVTIAGKVVGKEPENTVSSERSDNKHNLFEELLRLLKKNEEGNEDNFQKARKKAAKYNEKFRKKLQEFLKQKNIDFIPQSESDAKLFKVMVFDDGVDYFFEIPESKNHIKITQTQDKVSYDNRDKHLDKELPFTQAIADEMVILAIASGLDELEFGKCTPEERVMLEAAANKLGVAYVKPEEEIELNQKFNNTNVEMVQPTVEIETSSKDTLKTEQEVMVDLDTVPESRRDIYQKAFDLFLKKNSQTNIYRIKNRAKRYKEDTTKDRQDRSECYFQLFEKVKQFVLDLADTDKSFTVFETSSVPEELENLVENIKFFIDGDLDRYNIDLINDSVIKYIDDVTIKSPQPKAQAGVEKTNIPSQNSVEKKTAEFNENAKMVKTAVDIELLSMDKRKNVEIKAEEVLQHIGQIRDLALKRTKSRKHETRQEGYKLDGYVDLLDELYADICSNDQLIATSQDEIIEIINTVDGHTKDPSSISPNQIDIVTQKIENIKFYSIYDSKISDNVKNMLIDTLEEIDKEYEKLQTWLPDRIVDAKKDATGSFVTFAEDFAQICAEGMIELNALSHAIANNNNSLNYADAFIQVGLFARDLREANEKREEVKSNANFAGSYDLALESIGVDLSIYRPSNADGLKESFVNNNGDMLTPLKVHKFKAGRSPT